MPRRKISPNSTGTITVSGPPPDVFGSQNEALAMLVSKSLSQAVVLVMEEKSTSPGELRHFMGPTKGGCPNSLQALSREAITLCTLSGCLRVLDQMPKASPQVGEGTFWILVAPSPTKWTMPVFLQKGVCPGSWADISWSCSPPSVVTEVPRSTSGQDEAQPDA